jgi:hypothetical protein
MAKVGLILIALLTALSVPALNPGRLHQGKSQQQTSGGTVSSQEKPAITVTIATASNLLGPPTDHYRVGDQVPITITMTNTSTQPLSACVSSDLYQNLPKLTKDGELVPYMKWQSYERLNAQRNRTCEEVNLPEPVLLKPKEPTVADWFVLADTRPGTGAEAWYETLPPGKYELSIQRSLGCCDGPMVESNKVSFVVVP